jgi:hypothetical protein
MRVGWVGRETTSNRGMGKDINGGGEISFPFLA